MPRISDGPKPWPNGTPEHYGTRLAGRIFAEMRRIRKARGLSAQDVADAVTERGFPVSRAAIANRETRRYENVHVAELLALADYLDVPPLALLFPVGEETVELPGGRRVSRDEAVRWVTDGFPSDRALIAKELRALLERLERGEI